MERGGGEVEAGTEAERKTDGSDGDGGVARRAPYHVGKRGGRYRGLKSNFPARDARCVVRALY